jgi:hypothetical protein
MACHVRRFDEAEGVAAKPFKDMACHVPTNLTN